MNLPNKLTVFRLVLIPFCCLFLALNQMTIAAVIFILAALTDFLDGYIARKQKIVTVFGKFLDPVADKVLVLTSMVFLCAMGHLPAWAVAIVVFRELLVDGLRLVASNQKIVVPASMLGKIKTNAQFFTVISAMFQLPSVVTLVLTIVMAILTVLSGVQYFYQLKDVLKDY